MHMANELLSPVVAGTTCAAAAAAIAYICRKAKHLASSRVLPLMGVPGAFVFAAQMVNFPLPLMPGTSGHLVGAVLLAIILGPYAAVIVMSSVVIVQCLIFQDGGIIALGCNLINMAILPPIIGSFIYGLCKDRTSTYISSIIACTLTLTLSSSFVAIEAAASGVLVIPFTTFLITLLIVHAVIGVIEGVITAAVLLYIRQVRPDVIKNNADGSAKLSTAVFCVTILIATLIIGTWISHYASDKPDGLEWSYAERPDQPEFAPAISNDNAIIAKADDLQDRISIFPDYTIRSAQISSASRAKAWQSFAAVIGSIMTMALVYLLSRIAGKRKTDSHAPCTD